MPAKQFSLNEPLLSHMDDNLKFEWLSRDAVEGVQIFGGIGSGKTSGSGRTLALKYLKAGFGGLVLTAKPDERDLWERYCMEAGRSEDLLIVAPGSDFHFNFLAYESETRSDRKSLSDNILDVLITVIEANEQKSGGKGNDPFWNEARNMLISNLIDLCLLAYGEVSVEHLYNIAQSAPSNTVPEKENSAYKLAFDAASENIALQIEVYTASLSDADKKIFDKSDRDAIVIAELPDARTFYYMQAFFNETYKTLAEKTRSVIDFTFKGFLSRLLREPVFSMFCRYKSNFLPEDCLEGKIILLDLPVKVFHKVGRDCQIMFKYVWQRAMERRDISQNGRPVFLWADEAQNFLHEHDADYQATARSSRIATVYISQNLPNYYANMGGEKSDYRVKSFLGTLATKIFHANADIETNKYASELIGDDFFQDRSESESMSRDFSMSNTTSIKIERRVRPEHFAILKSGGLRNEGIVEAYLHSQANILDNDKSHIKLDFSQDFNHP